MTIYFDMDGTIADLYAQDNWLDDLIHEYTRPYRNAKAMLNMRELGKTLNKLQAHGIAIGVISWTSRGGSAQYGEKVARAKLQWLAHHLGAVNFNELHIVEYGTPKTTFRKSADDILFDDEEKNRSVWGENSFPPEKILEVLNALL
jgi:hypothetical protein